VSSDLASEGPTPSKPPVAEAQSQPLDSVPSRRRKARARRSAGPTQSVDSRLSRRADLAVLFGALVVAIVSAQPRAGGSNDGSRLAAVESLVDYHTLAIDDSIFVRLPSETAPPRQQPYEERSEDLDNGTIDRIKVGDHFYSDKPYVPSLYLAGCYWVLQWATGLRACERADWFCYLMTLLSSGLAYVVSVWCIYRMARIVGLSLNLQLLLTGSFALCTMALPYCQYVNSHILLLAVASALVLILAAEAQAADGTQTAPWRRALALGALAGLGYAIEQGVGQLLWGWTFLAVVYHWGWRSRAVPLFLLAGLPWMILHHIVNYNIGGTFQPANAVPAYFDYPGTSFNETNMTGRWTHESVRHFLGYLVGLWISDRGFLCFNLPLCVLLVGAMRLYRSRVGDWVTVWGAVWALTTYLLYAVLSSNFSGGCLSVRWFLPFLAPGFYALALLLRHFPECYLRDFRLLTAWGLVMGGVMWGSGLWQGFVPASWPVMLLAGCHWAHDRYQRFRQARGVRGKEPFTGAATSG
jgi:hypothetical protein